MLRGAPGKAQALSTHIHSKTFLLLRAKFSAQMLVVKLTASSRWSLLALQAPFKESTLSHFNGHFLSDHFPQRLQLDKARQLEWCQEWPPKWKTMVTRTSPPLPLFAQDSVPPQNKATIVFCAAEHTHTPRLRFWSLSQAQPQTLGDPWPSTSVPSSKPWKPRVYVNRTVTREDRLLPARGCLVPSPASCLCFLSQ